MIRIWILIGLDYEVGLKHTQTHINYYYNNGNMGHLWLLRSPNCELCLRDYECVFVITKIMVGSHAIWNLMFNDVLVEIFQHGKNSQSCKVANIGLVETKGLTKLFSHSTWRSYVSLPTTILNCTHVIKKSNAMWKVMYVIYKEEHPIHNYNEKL